MDLEDLAAVYIAWLARERGYTVWELAEGTLGAAWDYDIDDACAGMLRTAGAQLAWGETVGIFVRFNPEPPLPSGLSLEDPARTMFVRERREGLHQLLELVPCSVVNRPSAGRSNASKPYQMGELQRAGFDVPRWMASNSAEAAGAFVHRMSRGCDIQSELGPSFAGAQGRQRIHGPSGRRDDPDCHPDAPGKDVRVHTVGGLAFACEVKQFKGSITALNPPDGARYVATSIPSHLAELCCSHARAEGLVLAGFDFRVTPEGRWRCLEMNPVPSFLPYEFASGLPDRFCGPRIISE